MRIVVLLSKMAPTWKALITSFIAIVVVFGVIQSSNAQQNTCTFPGYIVGYYYHIDEGANVYTIVDPRKWGANWNCKEKFDHPKPVAGTLGANHTFLVEEINSQRTCYYCIDVLWRTANVLQTRIGACMTDSGGMINVNTSCPGVRNLPSVDEVVTMFRMANEANVNCISTLEGVYQFTYEVDYGGGGICDNPNSQIRACYDPGSPYIDNQVFTMQYAKCRDVATSTNKQIRYQCYGTWFAMSGGIGYTFAAISDTVEYDYRERFKCLWTNTTQKDAENKVHWVMSRFADCRNLNSINNGTVRLVLTRSIGCPSMANFG